MDLINKQNIFKIKAGMPDTTLVSFPASPDPVSREDNSVAAPLQKSSGVIFNTCWLITNVRFESYWVSGLS